MKIIVFDTETTGLPEKRNTPITDTHRWPHVVQFSWIEINCDTSSYQLHDYYVKIAPQVNLTQESINIHGITRDKVDKDGIDIQDGIDNFLSCVNTTDYLVGHNLEFDYNMLLVECARLGGDYLNKPHIPTSCISFCTMRYGEAICNIMVPGKNGRLYRKFPKLVELYVKLFGEEVDSYHNAKVDIICCARCFYSMIGNEEDLFSVYPALKSEI